MSGTDQARATRRRARRYAAVATGGFVGALLRYLLGLPGGGAGTEHAVVVCINTGGALTLGLLTGLWSRGRGPGGRSDAVRAFLGPGLLGGFTTFSAIAVFAVPGWGPAWLLAQTVLGVAAAWLGLAFGERLGRRADHRSAATPTAAGPGPTGGSA